MEQQFEEMRQCGTKLTLRQQLVQKGWDLTTNIGSERAIVTVIDKDGARLAITGSFNMEAVRYLEREFQKVVPFEISGTTTTDVGFTVSYVRKVRPDAQNYAEVRDYMRAMVQDGEKEEGEHGVIRYTYRGNATRLTFQEIMELDEEEIPEDCEAIASNEKQFQKLAKLGFERVEGEECLAVRERSEKNALQAILDQMTARFLTSEDVPFTKEGARVVASNRNLTAMQALTLDLNSLGENAKNFTYDGGKIVSAKALSKVSGWFPTGVMKPEEMASKLASTIDIVGSSVVVGYGSSRGLALGLMNARRAQIKVLDGGNVQYMPFGAGKKNL